MTTAIRGAALAIGVAWLGASPLRADDVVHLSLQDAEARAVQTHPQIRAAQYDALAAGERATPEAAEPIVEVTR